MPYNLDNEEFKHLLSLNNEERLAHAIDKIADWEEVWSICDDQGWLVQASENRQYISLWPHPRFVEDAVTRYFPAYRAEEIDFELLLDQWLPLLKQENISIAVLPDQHWQSVLLPAAEFEQRLLEALKQYR